METQTFCDNKGCDMLLDNDSWSLNISIASHSIEKKFYYCSSECRADAYEEIFGPMNLQLDIESLDYENSTAVLKENNRKRKNHEEDSKEGAKKIKTMDDFSQQSCEYKLNSPFFDEEGEEIEFLTDGENDIVAEYFGVKTITEDIKYYDETESLQLMSNDIEKIPAEISELTNLKYLDLRRNQFKSFPREILPLKNLKTLLIDENEIGQIPSEIGQLKSLKSLSVAKCQIKEIPAEIGDLSNLEFLDIEENKEIVLSDKQISCLQGLKSLNAGRTNVSVDEICKLKNLEYLKLDTFSSKTSEEIYKILTEIKGLKQLKFKSEGNYSEDLFQIKLKEKIAQLVKEEKCRIIDEDLEKAKEDNLEKFGGYTREYLRKYPSGFRNMFELGIKIENWKKDCANLSKNVKENMKSLLVMQLKDEKTKQSKYRESLISTLPKEILFTVFDFYLAGEEKKVTIFY